MTTISDRALLERALIAIEEVMARTDAVSSNGAGGGVAPHTPAREAVSMCLTAASALVDVAQSLLREAVDSSSVVLATEWQAVIAHTKHASRTAHQAVLVLSAQRNLVTAQGGIMLSGDSQL